MRKTPAQETAARKPQCCDTRQPGAACQVCTLGPDHQHISQNRALASNA